MEVVRSRTGRGAGAQDVTGFVEHAAAQIAEASSLSDGLLALTALVAARDGGAAQPATRHGAGGHIELMIYDQRPGIVSDIERLASRIGVSVEQSGRSVILTILPEGKSHSKD